MYQECQGLLLATKNSIQAEEDFDQRMRASHKERWNIMPSSGLNQPYKSNVANYEQKLNIAHQQDQNTKSRLAQQQGDLSILTKTRQELQDLIPKSNAGEGIQQAPSALAIKNALDTIESAKVKKTEILAEAVQRLANLNLTEDLVQVH